MHYFHQFQLPFKQTTYFIKCEAQDNVVILQCTRRFRYLYTNFFISPVSS